MTYQLKTTGLAANVRFMIFVDPDDDTVKHVAPGNLTGYSGVDKGANVTIGSANWNGVSRKYWEPGASLTADADFVKFSSNKPNWTFSTASQQRSIVWIVRSGANASHIPVAFGLTSSVYFALRDLGIGGTTMPAAAGCGTENIIRGNGTQSASTNYIVALTATHGSSFQLWYGNDSGGITDATESASPTWYTGSAANYDLDYVNRRNDSAAEAKLCRNWAIITFDDDLNTTELGTLQSDWFGTLLESATASSTASLSGKLQRSILLNGLVR